MRASEWTYCELSTGRCIDCASCGGVAVKGGHVVTTDELHALPQKLQNSDVQIADRLHLVAMRDVVAGEELTTDYTLFDDYGGSMECHCDTDACRHVIDGRDWMLPELQERYRGWFSTYLQRRIDGLG